MATGEGARFPATPFNAVICPATAEATPANAEVVRVTGRSTDTFTFARAQEGSTARTVVAGDRIFAAVTAKALNDIEGRLDTAEAKQQSYRHVFSGSDIGPLTSPNQMLVDSGSLVADTALPEVTVEMTASMKDRLSGTCGVQFYYGDGALVSAPLARKTQAALRPNTSEEVIGAIDAEPSTIGHTFPMPTTIGHTYLWEATVAIVGAADAIVLPDNAIGHMDISPTITDANRPPGGLEYGDALIVSRSATKLHVSKMNHESTRVDQLLTGAGVALTASSTTGGVAVSPDGKHCIVTHYGLGKASLYDLAPSASNPTASPSNPLKVGADLTVGATPYRCIWTDNDTVWLAGYGTNPGYVQKITGCSGASPSVQTAVNLTGSGATAIAGMDKTPDGTKLVLADGNAKVWVINTATSAVTSGAVPSGISTLACAISNTKAMVQYGTTLAEMTLSSFAFGTGLTSANFGNPFALKAMPDGNSVILHRGTGASSIRHILTTQGNRESAPNEYTSWNIATGTPAGIDMAINDHGNIIVAATGVAYGLYIWYGQSFYMRPSAGNFYSEKLVVTAKGAH